MEECGPCPVLGRFTLAFAVQLRKKHGKTFILMTPRNCELRDSRYPESRIMGVSGILLAFSPTLPPPVPDSHKIRHVKCPENCTERLWLWWKSAQWKATLTCGRKWMYNGRGQLKCDGTRTETRFRLSAKRTSPFKSAEGVRSVDCWQPRCAHQR